MTSFNSPKDIISFFDDYDLDVNGRNYLKFHALRYFILWRKVFEIVESNSSFEKNKNSKDFDGEISAFDQNNKDFFRILDIGPGFFTEILSQKLKPLYPNLEIYCLGIKPDYIPFKSEINFTNFDLNNLYLKPENKPNFEQFNLVICAEVLEHLYTGIDTSIESFSDWLSPSGYLIIQTPNAVSLHHRLKIVLGKNPFPLLRPNPQEPGHYREYTLTELDSSLKKAGFKPIKKEFHNYFNYNGSWKNRIYKTICNIFPQSFRDGITIITEK